MALSQLQGTYYSLVLVYRHSSTSPSMPRTLCQHIPSARKGTCGAHTLQSNLNRSWALSVEGYSPPTTCMNLESFSYHQDSFILIEVRQYYCASATIKRKKRSKDNSNETGWKLVLIAQCVCSGKPWNIIWHAKNYQEVTKGYCHMHNEPNSTNRTALQKWSVIFLEAWTQQEEYNGKKCFTSGSKRQAWMFSAAAATTYSSRKTVRKVFQNSLAHCLHW